MKRNTIIFGLIITIGVILSLSLFKIAHDQENSEIVEEFYRRADARLAALEKEIHLNIEQLHKMERFFKASKYVSRKEFQIFVAHSLTN